MPVRAKHNQVRTRTHARVSKRAGSERRSASKCRSTTQRNRSKPPETRDVEEHEGPMASFGPVPSLVVSGNQALSHRLELEWSIRSRTNMEWSTPQFEEV